MANETASDILTDERIQTRREGAVVIPIALVADVGRDAVRLDRPSMELPNN